MDQKLAQKIIEDTAKGYDLISEKFAQTRSHLWKDLEFVGSYCKKGDKVLDFGCGNGRLLDFLGKKDINYTGVDISAKLLKEASSHFFNRPKVEFQKISGLGSLPLESSSFNVIYAVAIFHHLPGKEMRKKVVEELYRILHPEGTIVISVWNLWQQKYWRNIFFNWEEKILERSELDWNDCYINFQDNRGNKFERFHHAFTKRELAELFSQAGFSIGKCDTINRKNIVLVGSK
jgi:ubiquinone/menaquinone biosynthesis C-methylase UbiE